MSKTLFWYLFRDLVRIFLMASGALAAIMSFGGLLRPLTENGLDAAQVGKMLSYLTPAMMAYSLPAAALFATTVTYGRLAADNELTACRAAGISYTVIGLPALVLGLMVAIFSILLLCFIVPVFSLRVEKVIYSNLANVIVNKIERNHQIRFGTLSGASTVFAQDARVLPADPNSPDAQRVELIGPAIVTYEKPDAVTKLRLPKEFCTAQSAVVRIHPAGDDPVLDPGEMTIQLLQGAKFPRTLGQNNQVGMESLNPPPMPLPNPIRENVKFMKLWDLVKLSADPSTSERVSLAVAALLKQDQEKAFLLELAAERNATRRLTTAEAPDEVYDLRTTGPAPTLEGDELVFTSDAPAKPGDPVQRQVSLVMLDHQRIVQTAEAHEARLRARADNENGFMVVSLALNDAALRTPDMGLGAVPAETKTWERNIDVPMDVAIKELRQTRTLSAYAKDQKLDAYDANFLRREQVVVNNAVRGELHSRASFAVSCLILVLVGSALGMMFKSGNFLTAFAVSFAPALLCITLVVAGQQTADHIPDVISPKFLSHNHPLQLGIALIWSGNAIVAIIAAALIGRLRRR
ncbi:MAG: LptF/LptG family permease [Tepidisphaeraceae bacterium]|jgi:lipopolysaccharide export LptBFGC system permease protein LptF